ncbi:MAG: TIGR00266 family protein [Deltaproteobacteria bacterium RIFOXYB12_FULL_58_9]|nr:MAG: TIGR00266 family protein [Deltaproteobacteria bacterium RIFOXYB12_FULL_58_9]
MTLNFEIEQRPDFAILVAKLSKDQKIQAEPSAMASMDPHIKMKTGMKGGLLKSVGRALGGESFFVNTFTAEGAPGEVVFAPGPMGDMQHYHIEESGPSLCLQRGSYVANTEGVEVTGKWDGVKGFFSGEGMVLLKATGSGDIFFNTFGALIDLDVTGDYYVDTGYIVAFEDTLSYQITTVPGLGIGQKLKTFFLGGEGLVCKFSGQGKLWIQTRCVKPFINWVHPFRPHKKSSS